MAASFTALVPPLQDDTMDISSPGQIDFDEDILLDDDDHPLDPHTYDEHMLEGDDRPPTARDEEMSDGSQPVEVPEEVMGDDTVAVEDEDLIDYSDEETEPRHVQPVSQAPADIAHQQPDNTQEPVQQAGINELAASPSWDTEPAHIDIKEPKASPQTQPEEADGSMLQKSSDNFEVITEPVTSNKDGNDDENNAVVEPSTEIEDSLPLNKTPEPEQTSGTVEELQDDIANNSVHVADVESDEKRPDFEQKQLENNNGDQYEQPVEESQQVEGQQQSLGRLDTSQDQLGYDGPGTPTDTGLHPTVLHFGDFEMPLFKSLHQPEGLLDDDNLASVSLADLLQNCRERLASKLGEEILEDQELILEFDGLACHLVETSRPAFETSLNDLLQIYVQLFQNDGVDDPPPFQVTLNHQLKFSSSIAALKEAAAKGQGMSSFEYLHDEFENRDEEDHHEQYDDQYYGEGTGEEEEFEEDESRLPQEETFEEPEVPSHSLDEQDGGDEPGHHEKIGNAQFITQIEDEASSNPQAEDETTQNNQKSHDQNSHQEGLQEVNESDIRSLGAEEQESQPEENADTTTTALETFTPNDVGDNESHLPPNPYEEGVALKTDVEQNDLLTHKSYDSTSTSGEKTPVPLTSLEFANNVKSETSQGTLVEEAFTEEIVESRDQGAFPVTNTTASYDESDILFDKDEEDLEQDKPTSALDGPAPEPSSSNLDNGPLEGEQQDQQPSQPDDDQNVELVEGSARIQTASPNPASAPAYDEDTIDFDDESEAQYAARKDSETRAKVSVEAANPSKRSLSGKRSFEQHADDEEIDFGSPDAKKSKAS